ncbi:MAG TPA: hypothetical protein DEO88_09285 [Syntrophobacteraceae bacterium]|nr:hypothetical protein [Syntrophobacteraceae bacterium]
MTGGRWWLGNAHVESFLSDAITNLMDTSWFHPGTTMLSFRTAEIGPAPQDSSRMSSMGVPKATDLHRYAPAIIFVLGVLLLLPGIGSETGITDKDEYWLSLRTPMETMARGDWLTPWLDGVPRLRKPPLLYWAILLTYKLIGVNLFAARIWSVLSGAGLALCACLIARQIFVTNGLLAGLITLATIAVGILGRMAMLDAPLAFLTSLAVYFSIRWWKSASWSHMGAASVSLALTVMLKGPAGPYFFALGVMVALLLSRERRVILNRGRQIAGGIAIVLVLCLPWPMLMAHLWPEFLEVMSDEYLARHVGDVNFLLPLATLGGALGLVFPWSGLLAWALTTSIVGAWRKLDRRTMWLVLWYLASVLPLFYMRAYERYLMPVLVPMCILCANSLETLGDRPKNMLVRPLVWAAVAVGLVFSCYVLWFRLGVWPPILCLGISGIVLWTTVPRVRNVPCVLSVAVLWAVLLGVIYPSLGIGAMPRGLSLTVGDSPAGVFGENLPSMLSMRIKRSVVQLHGFGVKGTRPVCCFDGFAFLREVDVDHFLTRARECSAVVEEAGEFKTFYYFQTWFRAWFPRNMQESRFERFMDVVRSRSLNSLKEGIRFYRIHSAGCGDRPERGVP